MQEKKYSIEEIYDILQSPELLAFLKSRISSLLPNQEIFKKPRVAVGKGKKGKLTIVNDQDDYDDEFEDLEYPEEELKKEPTGVEKYPFFISQEKFEVHKKDSVIVGGSLAALINEYIHGVPAKINDIDLFFYEFDSSSSDGIGEEMYENVDDEKHHYQIVKSVEEGILNKVEILPDYEFSWESLLDSFDLDSCQIGWNLSHDSLFFNRYFMEFLRTRVISLSGEFEDEYPLTTYIRGQVKAEELKAKFYLGEHLVQYYLCNLYEPLLLKQWRVGVTDNKDIIEDASQEFVTKKRMQIWQSRPEILAPWINLKGTELVAGDIFEKYHWHFFFKELSQLEISDKEKYSRFADTVRQSAYSYGEHRIIEEKKPVLNQVLTLAKSSLFNRLDSLARIVCEKPYLIREIITLQDLNSAEGLIKNHQNFAKYTFFLMMDFNYSLEDILLTYQKVKKQPLPLIGYLESHLDSLCQNSENNRYQWGQNIWGNNRAVPNGHRERVEKIKKFIADDTWDDLLVFLEKEHKKELDKEYLCDPLEINPFKKWVRELTKNSELVYEGQAMRHCVGGYGTKVKNGESRIFHIKVGDKDSTLELNIRSALLYQKERNNKPKNKHSKSERVYKEKSSIRYIYAQNKAVHNSQPSETHEAIARRLIQYLNNYMFVSKEDEEY